MHNTFFDESSDTSKITARIHEIEHGKIGFYSVGLYPASLAYNCAMQTKGESLLLAPRPGRDIFGAFGSEALQGMDAKHVQSVEQMASHLEGSKIVSNNLGVVYDKNNKKDWCS